MGIGRLIERALIRKRERRRLRKTGPIGDFWRAGGDLLLTRDLPIDDEDLAIDAGAYRGDWSAELLVQYGCRVMLIEAVPDFARSLTQRFRHNKRVQIVAGAIAHHDGTTTINVNSNSSSMFRVPNSQQSVETRLIDVKRLMDEEKRHDVACLKLNVEGAEYDVLERLIAVQQMPRVRELIVQFHDFAPDALRRRSAIQAALTDTHVCRFDYPFVWERWTRK